MLVDISKNLAEQCLAIQLFYEFYYFIGFILHWVEWICYQSLVLFFYHLIQRMIGGMSL